MESGSTSPVCLGTATDYVSDGLIATAGFCLIASALLWLLFAILRPKYKQVYAVRDWFLQANIRPQPLSTSLLSFLSPHISFIPSIPTEPITNSRSVATLNRLFPSDDELNQRLLGTISVICSWWTIVGIGGAIPLYYIRTRCIDALGPSYGYLYSVLQDLSILRLLILYDADMAPNGIEINLGLTRAEIQLRLIIAAALVVGLIVLPALITFLVEYVKLNRYRKRWIDDRCEGRDMAWLSVREAPGFSRWGERRIKNFLKSENLSSTLGSMTQLERRRRERRQHRRQNTEEAPLTMGDDIHEVDIESLFTISDTSTLAQLIDERDAILENLELVESKYIASFQLTTPEPSIMDLSEKEISQSAKASSRPVISGPKPLRGKSQTRRRRLNPAYAGSSLGASIVAPSQYYKLRGLNPLKRLTLTSFDVGPTLTESINQRMKTSAFVESRHTVYHSAIGSSLLASGSSEARVPKRQFSTEFGPNHRVNSGVTGTSNSSLHPLPEIPDISEKSVSNRVASTRGSIDGQEISSSGQQSTSSESREIVDPVLVHGGRGPRIFLAQPRESHSSSRRETFPRRVGGFAVDEKDNLLAPHLRVQESQPFVRPVSGLDLDQLGDVYSDISHWRSRLKAINQDIAEGQQTVFADIADGAGDTKGWILIGKGLRFVPGVELIEGRAKDDVRWDVLQHERTTLDTLVLWFVTICVTVALAVGVAAAGGLFQGINLNRYLDIFNPIANIGGLPAGLATGLVPALGATVFIFIAIALVQWVSSLQRTVSITQGKFMVYRASVNMIMLAMGMVSVAITAVYFAVPAFSNNSSAVLLIADGSVYMSTFAMQIVLVTLFAPPLIAMQPLRLWDVVFHQKDAVTPRQMFRALYPLSNSPSLIAAPTTIALFFAAVFSVIAPIVTAASALVLLALAIAHRYLISHAYARTHSQTGGLIQMWTLRRYAGLLCLQPLLMGLIVLSRRLWILGSVLVGIAVVIVIFVETFCAIVSRQPGSSALSDVTLAALDVFKSTAKSSTMIYGYERHNGSSDSSAASRSTPSAQPRNSIASVLEMMSITLAVSPRQPSRRVAVPLSTERLDDMTSTERAVHAYPDAPPHLGPLAFAERPDELSEVCYAPELLASPPTIWLPRDRNGIAVSEIKDLEKYHQLKATTAEQPLKFKPRDT